MKIYIGNFSYDITEDDLQEVFKPFGHVESIKIIKDKFTGSSKGFGFIEMPNKREAEAAMQGITEIKGRRVTINEARPQIHSGFGGGKSRGSRDNRREKRY